ncbi:MULTISPECIES: HAD family hydrolase [Psychrobacter]|uniref:HAD family hydrolase n=1 Tax=Psychrobacter TaxID=497 RepID=UPI000EBB24D3|nr:MULTISPECIES: HAD family hydrolase [Psychrobacter]HCN16702.1 HAD family hydrolase [Psychrobacter sp.]
MKKFLSEYKTLVFDCDGVILNSNKIKTEAFYQAALAYGEEAAQALVKYHVVNGGVSRYEKFDYFLSQILPTLTLKISGPNLDELLEHYAEIVLHGLLTCEVAEGLEELRNKTSDANWFIVSGGDQLELRHVFNERGLAKYFDGGVFGSPDNKDQILERELSNGNISQPALFLGDSKYDYEAAMKANLDFIFLSGWSEVVGWEEWCMNNHILQLLNLAELI